MRATTTVGDTGGTAARLKDRLNLSSNSRPVWGASADGATITPAPAVEIAASFP